MRMVVTGGAGFIGSNLVDQLVENGHKVSVIDNFSTGKKKNCNKEAHYYDLDLSDSNNLDSIKDILNNVDTIFHCAALARVQNSIKSPIKYEINNTIGIVNLLKCAVDKGVRRFVYSSSSSSYGSTKNLPSKESHKINPISPYAAQKYYGEVCCKMFSSVYGIETVSLRYFNVYGERQNLGGAYATVIGIFLNQRIKNFPLTINGSGKQRRDFTYVGDVVNANLLASISNEVGEGEVINVGRGKNLSVNDVAKLIGGDKVFRPPLNEPFENLADLGKARKLLNWSPKVDLKDWIIQFKREQKIN